MNGTASLLVGAMSLAACGSDEASAPPCPVGNATLVVTVSNLPPGENGNVRIVTAAGEQAVTGGPLTVQGGGDAIPVLADDVTVADPLVRTVYRPLVSPPTVSVCGGGSATVQVTYAVVPTSHRVHVGNTNASAQVLAYAAGDLASSGSPTPLSFVVDANLPGAFDREGNLWLIDGIERKLRRFSSDTLASSGSPVAPIEVASSPFTQGAPGPSSVAFDKDGNLWVGVTSTKTIVKLDAPLIAGELVPSVTLTLSDAPLALAFDKDGSLFATSGGKVVRFDGSRLAMSSADPPSVSVTAMSPAPVVAPLGASNGLAFDSSGNLWATGVSGIYRLTPEERAGTGEVSVTPSVQFALDVTAVLEGIAFDESFGLWVAYSQGKFARLAPTQLTGTGSVVPERIFSGSAIGSAGSFALYPAPSALPLYHALP